RRLYGTAAGFWAALLGLTSPFFLFMSASYMAHPSTMLMAALALYAFLRAVDVRAAFATEWAATAGLALGWAFISREATAVGVALPFLVYGVVDTAGLLRATGSAGVLTAVRRYAPMVLGAVPPLLILGAVNQAQLGSPFRLAQELVGTYDRLGFGPGFGPEEGGHTPTLGLFNALVYTRNLAGLLFGWPTLFAFAPVLLALGGIVWGSRPRARWDAFLAGGFLGLAGIYYFWWSATTIFGPRYWYEALPFLLLLAGRGITVLAEMAAAVWSARRPGWVVSALAVGLLVCYDLAGVLPAQSRAYRGYNDVDAGSLRRVEAAGLDRALVFVALQPEFARRDYGKVFFANDPLLRGSIVYARDLGADRNRALLPDFPGRQPYFLPLNGPPRPGVGP
ncbi:MAG TPA: hypothetical protein VM536_20445, partial [Chloroflexia bacterium]|nr:hypothetical protein [Chloroflexia bacterium]